MGCEGSYRPLVQRPREFAAPEAASPEPATSSTAEPTGTLVTFTADNKTFSIEEQDLRVRCKYFEKNYPHRPFPRHFQLRGNQHDSRLVSDNDDYDKGATRLEAPVAAFRDILAVVCQDLSWNMGDGGYYPTPSDVVEMAKLAAQLGCCPSIKGTIMSLVLATAWYFNFNSQYKYACEILEVAYHLQNDAFFIEALRHVVAIKPNLDSFAELPEVIQYIVKISYKDFQVELHAIVERVLKQLDNMLDAPHPAGDPPYKWFLSKIRSTIDNRSDELRSKDIDNIAVSKTFMLLHQCLESGMFQEGDEEDPIWRSLRAALPDKGEFNDTSSVVYYLPEPLQTSPPWSLE